MELPQPSGELLLFKIWPARVLPELLSARFPGIKTFAGRAARNPAVGIRLEWTPRGLSALVLAPGGDYAVEPAAPAGFNQDYRVFFTKDLPAAGREAVCGSEGSLGVDLRDGQGGIRSLGDTLKEYRIAVSATGEYTRFHGGTAEAALGAIAAVINHVNGIYERDLSVRLVLAEKNDRLLFMDPATDPFTGDRRGQNQRVADETIGPGNYDIGHLFDVGTFGRAEVASACIDGQKARAVSALPEPAGSRFEVDIVAHEIGHQLGATHTFNKCGSNQGPQPVEPGSGSTIMGWAGICGEDDLQKNSDAYFHNVSIREIGQYITFGQGRTCADAVPSGRKPPEVDAGPESFAVPAHTPFELIAQMKNDPVAHSALFSWEEMDAGPSTPIGEARGGAPIFRSWPPAPAPVRVFPRLADLLNNDIPFGEQLPSYGRKLTFYVTARDQQGGVSWDSLSLQVSGEAGPFRVLTLPVEWAAGETVSVEWDVARTDLPPVSAGRVDILLSGDGGQTFSLVLAAGTPNDGTETVRLPDTLEGDRFRLKVKAQGNVFFDLNDADFPIRRVTARREVKAEIGNLLLFPNPSDGEITLSFELRKAKALIFKVFPATGGQARVYELGNRGTGSQSLRLGLDGLPPGIYQGLMLDDAGNVLGSVRVMVI